MADTANGAAACASETAAGAAAAAGADEMLDEADGLTPACLRSAFSFVISTVGGAKDVAEPDADDDELSNLLRSSMLPGMPALEPVCGRAGTLASPMAAAVSAATARIAGLGSRILLGDRATIM